MSRRDCFPASALVRDLPRQEIVERALPLTWHGEFLNAFPFYCEILDQLLWVPKGFITDGASVPRLVWAVLSDTDPDILYPSYGHDFLYAVKGDVKGARRPLTRDECDQTIRSLMAGIGAPRFKRDQVYFQLKLWGGKAWKEKEVFAQ